MVLHNALHIKSVCVHCRSALSFVFPFPFLHLAIVAALPPFVLALMFGLFFWCDVLRLTLLLRSLKAHVSIIIVVAVS